MRFNSTTFLTHMDIMLEALDHLADRLSLPGNFAFSFSDSALPFYLITQWKRSQTLLSGHENIEVAAEMDAIAKSWETLHACHQRAYDESLDWERDGAELVVYPSLTSAHYRMTSLSDNSTGTHLAKNHRIPHLLEKQAALNLKNARRTFCFKTSAAPDPILFRAPTPETALDRFDILFPSYRRKSIKEFSEILNQEDYA